MQHSQAIQIGATFMDRSDVITLIEIAQTQDDYGRWIKAESARDVYVQVDSISLTEFYEAGRNGLNPEFRFRLFFDDYNGETECLYNGARYSIYRTYKTRNDLIELYVERKGGTNENNNT